MTGKRGLAVGAAVLAAATIMVLGLAPLFTYGADHLDAPGLETTAGHHDADINDLFVFDARHDASRTVLAVTTHPAAGVIASTAYATDVAYKINVDRNGDAVEDLAYVFRFGPTTNHGQHYVVTRYTGSNARSLAHGVTWGQGWTDGGTFALKGDGRVFAGLRSDPFFFDLDAFKGAVLGTGNGRTFCDQPGHAGIDFFAPLNANAIVVEVPDDQLGTHIGVWTTTIGPAGQLDRMGRPAINTVFNHAVADKIAFNHGQPSTDFAPPFSTNVIGILEAFGYTPAQATSLAHVLLPDLLTYDTSTAAAGPLNGRWLADDVIDAELALVTNGAVTTDCVEAHGDYSDTFPYLGAPHAA